MIERGLQKVIVGSALIIASATLLPIAKQTLRPVVRDLSRNMRYLLVSTKEGIEDIVAEVKFERMKKQLDKDMLIEYDGEIEEVKEAVVYQ
jgi:hypothetical protein